MQFDVTLNFLLYFIVSCLSFQSVNPERVSGDIVESLRDDHRSGRSLDSLDKTLDDFCTDSTFSVRKQQFPFHSVWERLMESLSSLRSSCHDYCPYFIALTGRTFWGCLPRVQIHWESSRIVKYVRRIDSSLMSRFKNDEVHAELFHGS